MEMELKASWSLDERLRLMQVALKHITQYILQYFYGSEIYEKNKRIPSNQQPKVLYFNLMGIDATAVLVHEACITRVCPQVLKYPSTWEWLWLYCNQWLKQS